MSFTVDWTETREGWPNLFRETGLIGQPRLRFLEIGCFEGAATLWLLENVLTDSTSRIDVIDTFEGQAYWPAYLRDFKAKFLGNIEPHRDRVSVFQGRSQDVLRTLTDPYDFVYIDGSHVAPDALTDAVLAWPLLKKNGWMVFDDYAWLTDKPELEKPKAAVDAFVAVFANLLTVMSVGEQMVVRKR